MEVRLDIYGIIPFNVDIVTLFNDVLNVRWTRRYSSFLGSYHDHELDDDVSSYFSLQSNFVDEEDEWQMPDFKEYPFLLYVRTNPQRGAQLEPIILSLETIDVKLLWTKTLTEKS